MTPYAVVVPTLVRDCLPDCLAALAAARGPRPERIVLVDDRPATPVPDPEPLENALSVLGDLRDRTTVLPGEARGPAAARNTGLRAVTEPWVVFVDDDVQVGPHWCAQLQQDLDEATPDTAGVPGVITVPLPGGRRPTDWERGTAGLARARWISADMAYRTEVLRRVGGFDERFPARTARTPTSRCGSSTPAGASAAAGAPPCTPCAPPPAGRRWASSAATPTTP